MQTIKRTAYREKTEGESDRKAVNQMKLTFDARPENEALARACIVTFLSRLDPDIEELSDLRTAVSEAVSNAIIHGYRNHPEGIVTLSASVREDKTVTIRVRDKGVGISDIEKAMQPLYTGDPSGERGGMGFAIMESFTDRLTVRSEKGEGTSITMIRKIGGNKSNV